MAEPQGLIAPWSDPRGVSKVHGAFPGAKHGHRNGPFHGRRLLSERPVDRDGLQVVILAQLITATAFVDQGLLR